MKSIRMAIGLAIVLIVPMIASAQSTNIYSWTDENGVKHFSDRAPANVEASSQEMVQERPTADSGDPANPADTQNALPADDQAEPTTGSAQGLSYADQQRKAIADRREAEKQRQAEQNQICLQARDQLARIEPNRRVFYTDEDGNTVRMDDEERVRMVEESKKQIAAYCD